MGWKVGTVTSIIVGNDFGIGFVVTNDHGRPVVSFAYPTQKEAEEAHKHVVAALKKAIHVVPG
jgi:hypothetical protein